MLLPLAALALVVLIVTIGLATHQHRAGASLFPQPALSETRKALAPIYEPPPVEGDPFAA